MNEAQFKETSYTITQIGFYLMNLGDIALFNNTEMHRNIVMLLNQMAVNLNANINQSSNSIIQQKPTNLITSNGKKYLSKQQVIDMCHPLITDYGLSQAIHTNDIPYLKRGKKYFFLEDDVKEWIDKKKSNSNVGVRSCQKFV